MKNFADRLIDKINEKESILLAGLDPRINKIPSIYRKNAQEKSANNEELIYNILVDYYKDAIDASREFTAIFKPNIAFFEALGISGLKALKTICSYIRKNEVLCLMDAKRGDIGSTAKAYSQAFLSKACINNIKNEEINENFFIDSDAITVNPYLGFDTLAPFLEDLSEQGKGIFVLVKTSNPGSADIQNLKTETGQTVAEHIAKKINNLSKDHLGENGISSIGAVIGATYPSEAVKFRKLMPKIPFLIPGFGAQGGDASDATASFLTKQSIGIVNSSRGIFQSFSSNNISQKEVVLEIKNHAEKARNQLNKSLENAERK